MLLINPWEQNTLHYEEASVVLVLVRSIKLNRFYANYIID